MSPGGPAPDRRPGGPIPQRSLLLKNWYPAGGGRGLTGLPGESIGSSSVTNLRMEDGVIVALGPEVDPMPLDREVDLQGAFLLPGLIDCHVHLMLGGGGARANARAHLAAGVTAVRSLGDRAEPQVPESLNVPQYVPLSLGFRGNGGSPGDSEDQSLLPTAVFAGRALAPAGRYGGFLGREVRPGDRLGRLVEEEVALGARVIKIILSGSVDFERGTAEGPYFDSAALAEIVAAARSLAVPVACHANGLPSVRLAAAAGVNSIEHGILAGEEGVRALAEADVCWVPTLTPLHNLVAGGQWAALPAILVRHREDVARGVALGVPILPGTDGGSPGVPHGSLSTELALLAQAGLSGEALVTAATRRAAQLLGLPRGYGRLETGAATDLVWFRGDPSVDPDQAGAPLGAVVAGRLAAGPELSAMT